jgi:hypothetical protein
LGNTLRPASSANETGDVKNQGVRLSWGVDAVGVPDRWHLYRVVGS